MRYASKGILSGHEELGMVRGCNSPIARTVFANPMIRNSQCQIYNAKVEVSYCSAKGREHQIGGIA
jgi:hypothetical protein